MNPQEHAIGLEHPDRPIDHRVGGLLLPIRPRSKELRREVFQRKRFRHDGGGPPAGTFHEPGDARSTGRETAVLPMQGKRQTTGDQQREHVPLASAEADGLRKPNAALDQSLELRQMRR